MRPRSFSMFIVAMTVVAAALILGSCSQITNLLGIGEATLTVSPAAVSLSYPASQSLPAEQKILVSAKDKKGGSEVFTAVSDNASIAYVDRSVSASFYINAAGAGTTKITVTSASGVTKFVDVTVTGAQSGGLPAAVTGVGATATPTGAVVSWSAAAGAAGYYVYRHDPGDANVYTTYFNSLGTATTFTDTTVGVSGSYGYFVTAYNGIGENLTMSNVATVFIVPGAEIIAANATWSTNTHLTTNLVVMSGATLTILPGVVVSLDPACYIDVDAGAALYAVGNAGNPILFKGYNGQAGYTDYNNGWDNIYVYAGGTATIKYATIQDTGYDYWAIECYGVLDLENSTVANNYTGGVKVSSATSALIANNSFGVNDYYSPGTYADIVVGSNTANVTLSNNSKIGGGSPSVN